ncbi:MAG: polyphosphate kinase 1 [Phycisphaeraceae bacterium]|nr:MAG: polyphosphate kinase 1 [Phycisphaeraceae bacterium]
MANADEFINRDLSWLSFNERVLAQSEDTRVPLLERVKFLAIFSSNLDEFFMKRVGLLKRRLAGHGGAEKTTHEGITLSRLRHEIRERVVGLQTRQAACWLGVLKPALADAGIRVRRYDELGLTERGVIDQWFDTNVFPILTPLAVDPSHRFPFISNLSENFGLLVSTPGSTRRAFARVKIPGVVTRYVPLKTGEEDAHEFLALDDLIAHNLGRLFPGLNTRAITPFRITRSAALDEEDEDVDDLMEQVEDELRRRRFADAVRLEAPPNASDEVMQFVVTQLGLDEHDVYLREGPLEFADLFQIASLPRPDLRETPWRPVIPKALRNLAPVEDGRPRAEPAPGDADGPTESIFARIRAGDILLHHPYESFEHSVERFVSEAADDPDVVAIKQTIYRTTPDSPFVRSLIRAAENGKNVACLVELRARFDEQRNVTFARQLEHAGVHVAYGVLGLKTHCKCSLVVRREHGEEGAGIRVYAHIGTGNYHPKTAQLYTDLGLLTANPSLTGDVVKIFNTLTGHAADQRYEKMIVAPGRMRTAFEELIDREIENAREGKPARIIAKMNQLEDRGLTRKLYEASAAGVEVRLIVRGFCCLRPGVQGLSENIRARSIIGRFLEHSRIYHFANGQADPEQGLYLIGSADWMYRNLNARVEATVPVEDRLARRRLARVLDMMWRDRFNAWKIDADGSHTRLDPDPNAEPDTPESSGTFASLMADTVA